MGEDEFVISHLRSQVRELQSLVNDLERCEGLRAEDDGYSHAKLDHS